jgi:hypothetical protein
MRLQLTTKQLLSAKNLLLELKNFNEKGLGSVNNVLVLKNNMLPNTIVIKYEKTYVMGGEYEREFSIATIKQDGEIDFIDKQFKDIFQKSAFLSECIPFDLEDTNSYQQID